jgi:hypothetical protein
MSGDQAKDLRARAAAEEAKAGMAPEFGIRRQTLGSYIVSARPGVIVERPGISLTHACFPLFFSCGNHPQLPAASATPTADYLGCPAINKARRGSRTSTRPSALHHQPRGHELPLP